jgi:hypothetical protein
VILEVTTEGFTFFAGESFRRSAPWLKAISTLGVRQLARRTKASEKRQRREHSPSAVSRYDLSDKSFSNQKKVDTKSLRRRNRNTTLQSLQPTLTLSLPQRRLPVIHPAVQYTEHISLDPEPHQLQSLADASLLCNIFLHQSQPYTH